MVVAKIKSLFLLNKEKIAWHVQDFNKAMHKNTETMYIHLVFTSNLVISTVEGALVLSILSWINIHYDFSYLE